MPRLDDPWFEAAFVGNARADGFTRQGSKIEGAQGIFLYSPCGWGKENGAHGLLIWFSNPVGAPPAPAECTPTDRWSMSGTGLHDLTLSPSVNCQIGPAYPEHNLKAGECVPGRLCWHGFITNGEVT
jgi:hypothetical protein